MDIASLTRQLTAFKKDVQTVAKAIHEIEKLDKKRSDNVKALKQRVQKLELVVNRMGEIPSQCDVVRDWLQQYKQDLSQAEEALINTFGTQLEDELGKVGFSLGGHYPDLKTYLFTVEPDFQKHLCYIWLGPKEEKLGQCTMAPQDVAKMVQRLSSSIGAGLPEQQMWQKVLEAYRRALGANRGGPAPILLVLSELCFLLQSPRFLSDPRKEYYRAYSRADFSFDLYRLRKFTSKENAQSELHLVVATMALTKKKKDYLWVPGDDRGTGTRYSHLEFRKGME